MNRFEWVILDELDGERASRASGQVPNLVAEHPSSTLDHEPVWLALLAKPAGRATRCYVCLDPDGALIGYAPFFVHPSALTFECAGWTLWSLSIRRWDLCAEPLFRLDEPDAEAAAVALLDRIGRDLRGRQAAFLLGLHLDSALGRVIDTVAARGRLQVVPRGAIYQRRRAQVGRTVEEFLGRLAHEPRRKLLRQERRLKDRSGGDVALSIHTEPESVPAFLAAAERVSRRTYQWNLLDMGLKDDTETRALFQAAAANRWFRGYVLRCAGQPVAFRFGYLYRRVYWATATGYDPDWSEWSPGNVLFLQVMRDLSSLGGAVEWFDFLYGDNPNKARHSTDSHPERNYYLLSRRISWRLLVAAWRAFDGCGEFVSGILQRMGLRDRARKLLRSRSTRSSRRDDKG